MTKLSYRLWPLTLAAAVALGLSGCSDRDDAAPESIADSSDSLGEASSTDAPPKRDTEPMADSDLPPAPAEVEKLKPEPDPASNATADATDAASGTAETNTSEAANDSNSGPVLADASTSKPAAGSPAGGDVTTGDWPMWGGSIHRNMVNATTGIDTSFQAGTQPGEGKNLLWTSPLGSQTYGNPVVAEGKVYVGTNNGGGYRPQHPAGEDRGVVLCFDEKDGKMLWQLTREKLPQGQVNDWPEQGICSTVCVDNGKAYVVTNRAELMCLDSEGFHDGENDGAYKEEVDHEDMDADIIWSLDMINDLGVFPHNLATSSPVILGDNVYIVTSNGVDEAHLEIPAPRAPSFICVNKESGELVWEDNSPFDKIFHGQWSSPGIGEVNGRQQVYFPGGDGWLYAFDPAGDGQGAGKLIWKFDCNPKGAVYELGGRGTANEIISTPVFYENSVVIAVGQDPEHGEGIGHLYRIDATKEGDVSPQVEDGNGGWKDNPNSAQIWHHGGVDEDGSVTGRKGQLIFRRTISTASVSNGLVIAADLSGFVHCLDWATGKRNWEYDMFAACWGSPMSADGKIFIGDEDGELTILALDKGENGEAKEREVKEFDSSIYSTPTIANGKMFVSDRSRLYCFKIK
jgi:outer membrane protein assembly factor BamB